VISASNRFSFLPIVVYISGLYSLGFVNVIYLLQLQMSRFVNPIQIMEVDRCYPVERVERLARCHSNGEKHYILTVLEGSRKEFYVLPLDDFLPRMK